MALSSILVVLLVIATTGAVSGDEAVNCTALFPSIASDTAASILVAMDHEIFEIASTNITFLTGTLSGNTCTVLLTVSMDIQAMNKHWNIGPADNRFDEMTVYIKHERADTPMIESALIVWPNRYFMPVNGGFVGIVYNRLVAELKVLAWWHRYVDTKAYFTMDITAIANDWCGFEPETAPVFVETAQVADPAAGSSSDDSASEWAEQQLLELFK